MHLLIKVIILIHICVFITSCEHSSDSGESSFESVIVEYNFDEQKYELVSKKLYSLDKPRDLNTHIAKFFYKTSSNVDLDYESTVKLNLIKTSDDVYLAKDLSSLKSISSYKIYEDYYDLHNKLDILNYSVWPKKVVVDGVDGEIKSNNAFHYPIRTSTFYLPFDPFDVPASLNPGIVAHEENHGLFYKQIINGNISKELYIANSELLKINYATTNRCVRNLTCGNFIKIYENTDEFKEMVFQEGAQASVIKNYKFEMINTMEYNHVLLRALDEGLADYSGFVFSKAPNFLYVTLDYEAVRNGFDRVVGSSLNTPLPSVNELQAMIDQIKRKPNVGISKLSTRLRALAGGNSSLMALSYKMAGQVSSLLNILSQNIDYSEMPASLTKEEYFFKLAVTSLENMKKIVFNNYRTKKMSFDDFFSAILNEKYVNQDTCSVLSTNISDSLTFKGCSK